ncbi:MAG TPA: SWIM zinc finger family protein [Tetragenococcus sp.]|nr:SWIM zinc finger family protein [Tetragenococcus sp.]
MSRYHYYDYDYESMAEKKEKAALKLKKYQKKHPDALPISIKGNKIANSFWGKAWCANLKNYADHDNRISRGRSYIKNGFVFDLKIKKGLISGVVCGSRNSLYQVQIHIDPLKDQHLVRQIGGNIGNLEELAAGKFPKALKEAFLTRGNGLFPDIEEIQFSCSCPDSAYMCKHISAVLYAVGAKLDIEPLLLFELRGVDTSTLIKKSVDDKLHALLENARTTKSKRIIEDDSVIDLFDLK